MIDYLIKNATIINEGKKFKGQLSVEGEMIAGIYTADEQPEISSHTEIIDAEGLLLLPGCIDDQVHFREPGLTHKAEIHTESRAAVAGGITSFMEMPNTIPQALTQKLLADKYELGAEKSMANYSFFMGASNENIDEIVKTDPKTVCGVKVFMGSSTGNMLVDNKETLQNIFKNSPVQIATHCEDEATIRANMAIYREKYGENVPIACHPEIRNVEACYRSSSLAAELAEKYGAKLHILHITTAKEISLFRNDIPLEEKKITAEACIHHLWFNDTFYKEKGTSIKWNPAIKTEQDRQAVFQAVLDDKIDVIATDHAPHTWEEKQNTYFKAPSGGPLVQHALVAMIEKYKQGEISLEKIVEKMAHKPAILFNIEKRGFLRKGYFADFVLVDPNKAWTVEKGNILYKCGWSPFEGQTFNSSVKYTFVNGVKVFSEGIFKEDFRGKRLTFDR